MSGVTAWADAMRALSLFAADPVWFGGIAVRAGAGPVRDQFLSLLMDLLPLGMPVRRLPPHAADDRLLGGLDLAATLVAGRPIAQLGLLAEADGGVVMLAMAERIEAGAAARLRAVLDEGVVALQRDGLSRVLPARFGIVALDEGAEPDERPPASLLDRLAFHVDLTEVSLRDLGADFSLRAEITRSSQALPGPLPQPPFNALHTPPPDPRAQAMPGHGTSGNRANAKPSEAHQPDSVAILCHAAMALGIDSPRAPLFALRAAHVTAASCDREQISETDLSTAARLVLVPRATRFPAPEEAEAPSEPEPPPPPGDAPSEQEVIPDQPLADLVLDAAKAVLPADLLACLASIDSGRGVARVAGRAGQFKASRQRGRQIGTRQGEPKNGMRLHLLETLKAAVPWQSLRRRSTDPTRFEVRRDDFRIVRFRQRIGTTTVFAVDASGSAAMHRLSEAKGAVELLLGDCYVRRDQVALLAFRGREATLLLSPTGSLLRAKRSLAGLPGGGSTPLAAGIEAAMALADTIRRAGRTPIITLLTDARANVARDGTGGRPRAESEALDAARAVRVSGVATLLVDTSPRPNPFARRLADEMRARYVALPYADASALSRAVRSAVAA